MAAVALVVVVILVVLGVHSCQVSSRNSALQDYGNNVSSLIQQSDQVSKTLFDSLSHGGGAAAASSLQTTINQTLGRAENELRSAKGLGIPGEVSAAQQNLILALQMRRDGIANIAGEIQPALGSSTNKDAINAMAAQMARFYASDVLYKDYTTPLIAGALHAAGIAVGGTNGESLEAGQFLPDLGWLTPDFIATKLGTSSATASAGKLAPGAHGHSLDSVSVNGTTLQTGSANTITASPAPTFSLNFTNGGQNTETNVQLKVVVSGTSVTGQAVVPQTTAGEHATGQVLLSSSPPAGTYTVTATVAPVPGEKDTSNNSLSFPVTFQ
ncbi:MAG: hypothetical protein ACR2LV_08665 [Solirubrobacteraceae bacterium]